MKVLRCACGDDREEASHRIDVMKPRGEKAGIQDIATKVSLEPIQVGVIERAKVIEFLTRRAGHHDLAGGAGIDLKLLSNTATFAVALCSRQVCTSCARSQSGEQAMVTDWPIQPSVQQPA